jgi:FkbM family methyltransferase
VIVVDLGCQPHEASSLPYLAETYKPSLIYGFDPWPDLDTSITEVNGVPVALYKMAAWTYDGHIGFSKDGDASKVADGDYQVQCFDFPAWLDRLGAQVILKMDIEGAEYTLLPALEETGAVRFVDALLVEWHDHAIDFPVPTYLWPF